MSREVPFVFRQDEVRANRAGLKDVTRRLIKPQPELHDFGPGGIIPAFVPPQILKGYLAVGVEAFNKGSSGLVKCRWKPGDVIWARETWWEYKTPEIHLCSWLDGGTRCLFDDGTYHDEPQKQIDGKLWVPSDYPIWHKHPSIHMPRWACRNTYLVVSVRAERLQDITEEDVDREGFGGDFPTNAFPDIFPSMSGGWGHLSMVECYARLWDHINGKGSWAANPWVWRIEYRNPAKEAR